MSNKMSSEWTLCETKLNQMQYSWFDTPRRTTKNILSYSNETQNLTP